MQINRYLVRELQARGLWDEQMISDIKKSEGSVHDVERIPAELREIYRTAWEIPQRALIDMAADRGAFIDQSQSLNLFMETPTIGKLSSMYLHAWKRGLKTTYYLRSRPATKINKATVAPAATRHARPRRGGGGRRTRQEDVHRRRGDRLQPREPRSVRGVRLMALIDPITSDSDVVVPRASTASTRTPRRRRRSPGRRTSSTRAST